MNVVTNSQTIQLINLKKGILDTFFINICVDIGSEKDNNKL